MTDIKHTESFDTLTLTQNKLCPDCRPDQTKCVEQTKSQSDKCIKQNHFLDEF